MKKRFGLAFAFAVGLSGLFATAAPAATYVCASETNCDNYTPITATQLALTAPDTTITVQMALQQSADELIKNGYNSVAKTDLGITKWWHKGGSTTLDQTYYHITVRITKTTSGPKPATLMPSTSARARRNIRRLASNCSIVSGHLHRAAPLM